jgi:hypothetical protein
VARSVKALVIVTFMLGCGRESEHPRIISATINQEERGGHEPLRVVIDDQSELKKLLSQFDNLAPTRKSDFAGTWKPTHTIEFTKGDKEVVTVLVEFEMWRVKDAPFGDHSLPKNFHDYLQEVIKRAQAKHNDDKR